MELIDFEHCGHKNLHLSFAPAWKGGSHFVTALDVFLSLVPSLVILRQEIAVVPQDERMLYAMSALKILENRLVNLLRMIDVMISQHHGEEAKSFHLEEVLRIQMRIHLE